MSTKKKKTTNKKKTPKKSKIACETILELVSGPHKPQKNQSEPNHLFILSPPIRETMFLCTTSYINIMADQKTQRSNMHGIVYIVCGLVMMNRTCCFGVKRFFSGMLNQKDEDRKQFARRWILDKVEQQHRIRFMVSLLMHAFVEFSCQSVTFANISAYMVCKTSTRKRKLEPSSEANEIPISDAFPTPLKVDQTIIHTALSLVCSTPTKTHTNKTTPLHMYYRGTFTKTKNVSACTELQKEFGNGEYLHGTSLQYCARQMRTDFCSMMQNQLWPNTISWVRKELADINPELFTLFPARSVVVKAIMGWLFVATLGAKVVLGKTAPPTDLSSMEISFMECMQTKLKKHDYFSNKTQACMEKIME